jgi:hypothetical protein
MRNFGKLSEITLDPVSWQNRNFLTFDLDWACDEVIRFTIEKLIQKKVPATIFVTHQSSYISEIKNVDFLEFGPHPNFNFLCNSDVRYGKSVGEVLDFYEDICTGSVIRSHDSFLKTEYLKEIAHRKYSHESNIFISRNAGMTIQPFRAWGNEVIRAPITWEDDEWFLSGADRSKIKQEFRYNYNVWNFHPIHIFLNTEKFERYYNIKEKQHSLEILNKHINKLEYGTRSVFYEVINYHEM